MAITVKEAQTLFVSYFGRPADFEGLQYWTGTETLVGSLEQLAQSFFESTESRTVYGVNAKDIEDFNKGLRDDLNLDKIYTDALNGIYFNMFGRVPETAGFDYWFKELMSGNINIAQAAVAVYRGAQGKDATMVANKIAAATQFTEQVGLSDKPSLYYGEEPFKSAKEFLSTVTDTTDVTSAGFAAQVNAAVTAAEAKGGTSETGGEFTFVIGRDSGILTNEVNDGFGVPADQSKYLTSGNDVIDITGWTGSGQLTISDSFANDNDSVLAKFETLAGVGSNNLKLASIENLQIINSGDITPLNLNGNNFKGLEAIKLIGEASNFSAAAFTYGIKVDATPNADSIIGSDKADTINGGAGNDTIVGNDGVDILTGGNGADTFVVGTVKAAGIDQILDFSAEDKIALKGFVPNELKKFDASTFSTVTYKTLDSVLATFGQNGANETKAGDIAIFTYDGKTYALLAKGAFDVYRDALIDITGTNVASLTESNFGDASSIPTPTPNSPAMTYSTYAEFKAAVDLNEIATGQLVGIATITAAEAKELATNTTYLDKIAAGGIKAITGGNVITASVSTSSPYTFNAAAFDAKLDPSIITAGTVTMNITGNSGTGDTIAASVLGGVIDGNGDKDTIKLNTGKDVVKISEKTEAGMDTIIGFDVTKDVLSFKTTTGTLFDGLANLERTGSLTDVSDVSAAINNATVNTVYKGSLADLKAKLIGDGTSASKVILGVATDAGNEGIYALTLASDAVVSKVEKVVTLTGVDLNTLTMDNFATFA